jgi:hypothetical protein
MRENILEQSHYFCYLDILSINLKINGIQEVK